MYVCERERGGSGIGGLVEELAFGGEDDETECLAVEVHRRVEL